MCASVEALKDQGICADCGPPSPFPPCKPHQVDPHCGFTPSHQKLPVSWAKWKHIVALFQNIKWKLVYLSFFDVN